MVMALEFHASIVLLLTVSYPAATIANETSYDGDHLLSGRQAVIVSTSTVTLTELCARLVNVTGACRRRRAKWEEEPVVMTFHDDDHSVVDELMAPIVSRIETTAVPAVVQRVTSGRNLPTATTNGLRSSFNNEDRQTKPATRIYFVQLAQIISSISSRFFPPRTSIVTKTVTVTNTFFIQLCTPSPFPFKTCTKRRSNRSTNH